VSGRGLEPLPSMRGLAPQASASAIPPPGQVELTKDERATIYHELQGSSQPAYLVNERFGSNFGACMRK
jgi:hypothetical protein